MLLTEVQEFSCYNPVVIVFLCVVKKCTYFLSVLLRGSVWDIFVGALF